MKKNKQKAIVKEQKKVAKKDLTAQITTALSAVMLNLGTSGKKVEKLISKNAKQLAKKLSKEKKSLVAKVETVVEG